MKLSNSKFYLAPIALAASLSLAACGGGGSGSVSAPSVIPKTPVIVPPTVQNNATAIQKFSIMIPRLPVSTLSKAPKTTAANVRKSLFVSPDTSNFVLLVDGVTVATLPLLPSTTPGAPATTGSDTFGNGNEKVSYVVSAYTSGATNVGYYQIGTTLDLLPGTHNIGVVLSANDGFVLSEAQTGNLLLTPGANSPVTLALKGVADSAFICNWPSCDGSAGTMNPDGSYNLVAFVADHEGDTIFQQSVPNVLALDNAPYAIVEEDALNAVSINGGGAGAPSATYNDPGNDVTFNYTTFGTGANGPINNYLGGQALTVKCLKVVPSVTIGMQLTDTSPLGGSVSGFVYNANNWTTPNQKISTISPNPANGNSGSGNNITIGCDANLQMTLI